MATVEAVQPQVCPTLKEDDHVLFIIHVPNREDRAVCVQKVLTKYGASIKTRLGLHDNNHGSGIIMTEMMGDPHAYHDYCSELRGCGADAYPMVISHHEGLNTTAPCAERMLS
ncbi:hypothetical protein Pelo_12039 [Pelomyxa schiedti]|nr:hypothetical protein Pelo_12039 [Pelomyxa schiedti]